MNIRILKSSGEHPRWAASWRLVVRRSIGRYRTVNRTVGRPSMATIHVCREYVATAS